MLSGKGYYIHYLSRLSAPVVMAQQCVDAGITHIIVKIADGALPYNKVKIVNGRLIHNAVDGQDLVKPLVPAMKARGVQVWGFQYIYGRKPADEAQIGSTRALELGLDGFVINAEKEFKEPNMSRAAKTYGSGLWMNLHGEMPIAFSSYRYPQLHPLPYNEFLTYCDLNMPQVYWAGTTDPKAPALQLKKSVDQYNALSVKRPIFPTGAAYKEHGWQPTNAQVYEFMKACKDMGFDGCNFWEYYYSREFGYWNTIKAFSFEDKPPVPRWRQLLSRILHRPI